MKRLVIDANVAAKWYLPEVDSQLAEDLLSSRSEFHAPDFLSIEVANIFWKHSVAGRTSLDIWRAANSQLRKSIPYWHADEQLLNHALELAITHKHPVFDCIYLALALQIDGVVVTADKQFCNQFGSTSYGNRVMALHNCVAQL